MKIIKTIVLKHDLEKAAARLRGKPAEHSHVARDGYINETCRLVAPGLGTVAMLFTDKIPRSLWEEVFDACWPLVKALPSNRATAAGFPSLPKIRKDGTLGPRRGVPKQSLQHLRKHGTAADVLGFQGGPDDKSHFTERHLALLNMIYPLTELVDGIYRANSPLYEHQESVIRLFPNRRLWSTAFSSIYLSKKWATSFHRDGNLNGAMTALMATGDFKGGDLVIPRWRIGIKLRPGDLLLFDAEELHGNLEIEGDRLSFAFYCASLRRLLE